MVRPCNVSSACFFSGSVRSGFIRLNDVIPGRRVFRRLRRLLILFAFPVLALTSVSPLFAQSTPSLPGQEGVHRSLVPVFGYKSDVGLFGGAVFQRIDYGEAVQPFENRSAMEFTLSTRGHLTGKLDYEELRSFGTDIRSRYRFEILRILEQTYFGIGNETPFIREAYRDGFYGFTERSVRFRYQGRKRMVRFGDGGHLEGQFLLTVSGSDPVSSGEETLFETESPPGSRGGWVNLLGAGLVIERRDSEFDPGRGYRVEASVEGGGDWTLSDYRFGRFTGELRGYFTLGRRVVVAQKVELSHAFGEPPFWELPSVGHDLGLRGYALNRFRGHTSLVHILELRSWVFSVLDDQIRLGGQLFMDTGRVFDTGDRLGDITSGIKQTFGIGGTMSIINPDFIFRGEIGFSDELFRVYIGLGYLF